jgi:hypothetical protein
MYQYILLGLAALAVLNGALLESLASSGGILEYLMAVAVALLLVPWLRGHFD